VIAVLAAGHTVATAVAAAAADTSVGGPSTAEEIAFWILAPLSLLGAVGMVMARVAVHSALWLVLTMLCLGCMYITQEAEFLGFAQIIVYTGAIMMLFLFVLMLTGRDAGDSVIEVLRGQRAIAATVGIGLVALIVSMLVRAFGSFTSVGLSGALADRGAIGSLAVLLFTTYLFPFELTSALLITAAVGAMVLAHVQRAPGEKKSQRQRVAIRMRSDRMSPLPGPGVFATSSSNATPALLPDGSIAPGSVSHLVEVAESERVARDYQAGRRLTEFQGTDRAGLPTTRSGSGAAPAGSELAVRTDGDGADGGSGDGPGDGGSGGGPEDALATPAIAGTAPSDGGRS
jgi:NADH-quinone oxidoreductase subunit J